jgi:bacteriocin-like protein
MTTTIKTAATSKQVREPTHELSEDELNAVAGGLLKALETFGKALQKAGQI